MPTQYQALCLGARETDRTFTLPSESSQPHAQIDKSDEQCDKGILKTEQRPEEWFPALTSS